MLYKKPQRCFWLRLRGKLREVPLSSVAREFEMAYRAFRREKGRKSSTDAYLCNSSFSRACNVDAWNNAYKKWMLRLINPDSEVWLHTHRLCISRHSEERKIDLYIWSGAVIRESSNYAVPRTWWIEFQLQKQEYTSTKITSDLSCLAISSQKSTQSDFN